MAIDDYFCSDTSHRLKCSLLKAFRTIVPRLEDRIELTWTTSWRPTLCFMPFIYMAYLARRPDTYYYRLALLPFALSYILYAAYSYVWTDPRLNLYNWGQCLFAAVALSKTLEYGLMSAGMLKKGEIKPGIYPPGYTPPSKNDRNDSPPRKALIDLPVWLSDPVELIHTMRGLQYQFSRGVHVPPPTRPQKPVSSFFRSTLISFLSNLLLLDFLESLIKLFPLIGRPRGGTIFDPSLPVYPIPWRYISSTTVQMLTGTAIMTGFGLMYDLYTLLGVGLCGQQPSDWPPIMDDPWASDSLHVFWGRRWHQEVRQTILVLGGYPARYVVHGLCAVAGLLVNISPKQHQKFAELGMLFGTFIASGLFHECSMYSMGRGFDHSVALFFALQGPLMLVERVFKRVMGRQVGGWAGKAWLWCVLFLGGQKMVNAWHLRGMGAGMVIPPVLSPTRMGLFPLIRLALRKGGVEAWL